tara:strand:- start:750 stop:1175 length:426 start_codon:yes stop_codon:yes gene_type:complete
MSAPTDEEPVSVDPTEESHWRFYPMTQPTEWIEAYHPGGLHPIEIGDGLHNGRYKILQKLGYGASSTVWLAQDSRCARTRSFDFHLEQLIMMKRICKIVAIRVARTDARKATKKEVHMFQRLQQGAVDDCAESRIYSAGQI